MMLNAVTWMRFVDMRLGSFARQSVDVWLLYLEASILWQKGELTFFNVRGTREINRFNR
jgi:hypothetical protein